MNPRAWILGVGMGAALVACHGLKPGEASLHFEGETTGHYLGGGVTCPPVSSVKASWVWQGSVGGESVSVSAHALNSTGIPDALLINAPGGSWLSRRPYPDEAPADGQFAARVDDRDRALLYIEGSATHSSLPPIKINGSMRCPCAEPPCFP
jgi:hypothetical protein